MTGTIFLLSPSSPYPNTVRGFSRGIQRRGVQCRVEEGKKEKEGTSNSGLTGSPSNVLNRSVWTQLLGDPIGNCTKTGTFQRQLLATIMVIPITAI